MLARLVRPVPLDAVENLLLLLLLQVVVAGQGDVPAQLGLDDRVAAVLQDSQAGADWGEEAGQFYISGQAWSEIVLRFRLHTTKEMIWNIS